MQIQPLRDKILVRPLDEEKETKSGIIIPDTAGTERPQKGEVLAVGPGKKDDNGRFHATEIKPGDYILFAKYSPTEIKIDGEELFILGEGDVLGIIK
ncbi:co-chaperone GroES [Candidatus Microgenomates bacterium]|nr:co-chaperone GroES [Candidatus Microgenomates bacterium]